jgi:hypothetical protein
LLTHGVPTGGELLLKLAHPGEEGVHTFTRLHAEAVELLTELKLHCCGLLLVALFKEEEDFLHT